MSGDPRDLLLLRHRGVLWGVENRRVLQVAFEERDGLYRVVLWDADRKAAGTRLTAETVLGVATAVPVHFRVGALRRFWTEPIRGLAVHEGSPVVVLDPDEPPGPLTGRDIHSEGG